MTDKEKKETPAKEEAPDVELLSVVGWLREQPEALGPRQLQDALLATWGMERTQKEIEAAMGADG
jgi:hypothetical protein